ncbi:hypothetical protein LTR56_027556 [Elasticomyces elasticus]|nr:hypothetical protein LTR56_027556 [Elasticomyces elasticus]KAK3621000.1 hypothetical protein LTR22_025389 [Elasticomyces elasticus]KAK4900486.1 hypothetical protein LTR49_027432 [Elasticomyces elasticus]KAK5732763.1 hypothetical protein LTS12_027066 [Elasticomyces elasticus]
MEKRDDLELDFRMHRIVDDASENRKGWSFLQHPQNLDGLLPNREYWPLDRIVGCQWLQEEFFHEHSRVNGHHRNVFVENGRVSTVTTYHKGYSIPGSTKIIHRYLPKEVGDLLVYYLWIVRNGVTKLQLHADHRTEPNSPFIWAKGNAWESWDSSRLSRILRREFQACVGITLNIPTYRHLAIAISRKHLGCGGFQREYGLKDTKFDWQAAHSPWTAGSIYARGLEEGAGHVEAGKAEYRKISDEWHHFL